MERPRLQIPLDNNDKYMEYTTKLCILLLIALPIYYYGKLPDSIPSHFGGDGMPDKYSNKDSIWIMPFIGTFLYRGLAYLNKLPHIFNYTVKITEENALEQYTKATKMMRFINLVIAFMFTYITYTTIQVGLGNSNGLGIWFLPFIFISLTIVPLIYLFKSTKKNKS